MRHSIMDTVSRQVALLLVFTVGRILCEPPLNNQYGVPGNYAGSNNNGNFGAVTNNYGPPLENGHDENQDYVDNQPKSYEFGYAVKDLATGNDFGRRESSDGETVRGEYRVQLPDGRTQIVTYTADWRTGFHADVRYEGVATYPDRYSTNNNGYNNNNAGSGYDFQGNSIDSGYNRGNNGYQNYQNNGGYNQGYNQGNNQGYNQGYNNPGNSYNYQLGPTAADNNYNYAANSGNSLGTGAPPPVYGPPGYQ